MKILDTKRFKVRPPLAQHRASISRRPRDPQANINGGGSVAVGGGSQSRLSRLPPNDNLINLKNSQFEELVKAVKIIDEQKFKISGFIAEIKDLKMVTKYSRLPHIALFF